MRTTQPESPDPRPPTGAADAPVTDDELRAYIRKNLVGGAVALVGLILALALIGKFFEPQLVRFAAWTLERTGLVGMAGILLLTDSFITPVPPDVLLIVIAKSPYHPVWWLVVPGLGVISSVAGLMGWAISARVGRTGLPRRIFGRAALLNEALVAKHGPLAVALGATTPIPFSITCWAAGMFGLPFRRVWWVMLLRVPRFVGYYLVIIWSLQLLR